MPETNLFQFFIKPSEIKNNLQLYRDIQNKLKEFYLSDSNLKSINVSFMKRKNLKWAQENSPSIKQLNGTSIIVDNIVAE